jgi:hypothetical protein
MNQKNTTRQESATPNAVGARQQGATTPEQVSAIVFLERQHVELQELFAQMKAEATEAGRRMLLEKVATYLRNHSAIEERHFYPGVLNEETESLLKDARKEHKEAEEALGKLFQYESYDDDFVKKFDKLVEDVQHHIHEEENELFPQVAKEIPMSTLVQIREEMERSYRHMLQSGPSISDRVRTTQKNTQT